MENNLHIKIKYISSKIVEKIKEPFYATGGAAGMDLSACIDKPITLKYMDRIVIPTGIAIQLSSNQYVALIFARSGLAIKHGITMSNGVGVVDSDYTGEIMCGLVNLSKDEYTINPGDRIAQIVFTPIAIASMTVVNELSVTDRGQAGLGSTGK